MATEIIQPDDERFFEHDGIIRLIRAEIGYDPDLPADNIPVRFVYRYEGERTRYSRTFWLTRKNVTDLGRDLLYVDCESSR